MNIKCWEMKGYNTESSCTGIIQHFGSSFGIIYYRNWNFWFSFATCLHPWKIISQVNNITCLWVDTLVMTANAHVILHKDARHLVKIFTHNIYLVVSPFLFRELRLRNLINWNHPPYLCHNLIFIYLMKVIRILALLRHIFLFFFNIFLQNNMISPLLTTMWYHRDGCATHYCCAPAIYLLSCISL